MNPIHLSAALLLTLAPSARQVAPERLPQADPAQLAAIRAVLDAATLDGRAAALAALRAGAGARHERLVPELFRLLQQATDTREGMAFGVLIEALPIPPEHVVEALLPWLESEDVALRAAVGNVFAEYEDRSPDRGASFTVYRPFLARGAPLGLVRHLFATDPGAALLAFARLEVREGDELRALLWAEHSLADALWRFHFASSPPADFERAEPEAVAQLAVLASHPRWWARLAAVELGLREPVLRARLPLEALARDGHALVRERAALALQAGR